MSEGRIRVGEVYIATAAIEGQRRRLAVVIGIEGQAVQVGFVDELATGRLEVFNGRDTARLETRIGQYNISAAAKATAKEAAIVNDILKAERGRRT